MVIAVAESRSIAESQVSWTAGTMFEKEVNRYIAWVEDNLPLLAMRDSPQIRRIVSLAVSETRITRIVLSILGGVLGLLVGKWVLGSLATDSVSESVQTAAAAVCGVAATYVTAAASEVLVHRRIRFFADET